MNAREVALQVIRDVFPQNGAPERGAQEALDYRATKAGLDARDRAFATELSYGAIKMRRALDWYLAPYIGNRDEPLNPIVNEILRLGIFEIVYTRPDVHATVFETVNVAKHHGHRGIANLVNAVLRSFLRDEPAPPQREDFEQEDDFLGTKFSLPSWMVRMWRGTFGDRVEEICAGVNGPQRSAITVNTLKTEPHRLAESISVKTTPSAFVPESLLLAEASFARRNESNAAGAWWTQSESSAMPVDILNPQPEEAILDVCSGRGNKALQIGARLAGAGSEMCIELDSRKGDVLMKRLEEAGIGAAVVVGNAADDIVPSGSRFDRVLIDAPCSGAGIIGRHPEARWKKQPGDGERLGLTQRAILDRIAPLVHEGGALVYAVCSTDPRETIEVVEWFRARHNFERGLIPSRYEPLLTDDGDVLIAPGIEGRDGFFIARLERR